MVINSGPRHRTARYLRIKTRYLRIVVAVLLAVIVAVPLDFGPAAAASAANGLPGRVQASPDQQSPAPSPTDRRPTAPRPSSRVTPSQIGIQAKSTFEQTWNPFGEEWSLKEASPAAGPIGVTPVCYRLPEKPDAAEDRFAGLANHPFIFSECVDLPDVLTPANNGNIGSPRLKQIVAALKAKNASAKYIAFQQLPRADTNFVGGDGATVGLTFIDRTREDWFVHIAGQAPTRANRVKYNNNSSDLFDVTNAEFRQYMVNAIVASLDFHDLDGFFLSDCLDLPFNSGATPVPAAINAAWEGGCDALFQSLKAALTPLGKLVFTVGFDHIGTRGLGGVNEAAALALFQKRMGFTDGLFWEDPFRASNVPDFSAELSFDRYKQLRDYAVPRGRYLVHTVNTREGGQSSFATTDAGKEKYLARYYFAQFLAASAGQQTVMYHYFPTSISEQFTSSGFFKDWDLPVGDPLGPDTKPVGAVYRREFRNARVVANLSSSPFTVDLSDGSFTDADGVAVVGTSAVVPAKTGGIFMRVGAQVTCSTPRPPVQITTTLIGPGQMRVTVAVTGTGAPGNNVIRSIRFNPTLNATIDVGNQTRSPGNFTLKLPFDATQTSFVIRRTAGGTGSTVQFVVTDGCGDWPSFAGIGPNVP